jgi:CTP:molybdopterin cytidylyltransferase MocA
MSGKGEREGRITALLLAGRRPGTDPLAAHFGVEDKVLIPVGGEPMISRVARALLNHPRVGKVIVLTQAPEALVRDKGTQWLGNEPRLSFESGGSSVSLAIADALGRNGDAYPFLITTADNALLDETILDAFITGAGSRGADIAAGLVERRVLLAAYPESRRTWLKFRGAAYSGANLFWVASPRADAAFQLWRTIEQQRKRASAITRAFGPLLLALVGLRLIGIDRALRLAGARLGLKAAAVEIGIAEACIDIDKPEDHALASRIIAARGDAGERTPAS